MSRNIARYVRQLREQVARLEVPEVIEEQFGRYGKDPVGFCQDVLGVSSATRSTSAIADCRLHAQASERNHLLCQQERHHGLMHCLSWG